MVEFLRLDLTLRGIDGELVVAIVDLDEKVASLDRLVVDDGDEGDVAGHFRGDHCRVSLHVRVVS